MGVFEPFVGPAQVAVGVDMQNPEPFAPLAERLHQSVGSRVVAADQADELALRQPRTGLRTDIFVHLHAAFVHAADFAADRIVGDRPALFEVADHPLGVRAQPLRSLQQRVVDVGRGDAAPPRAGRQSVVEVELHRGFDNGVGRLRRPRTVGNRNVPRRRNQHQPRLVGRERQAEIGPVVEPYPIGVECIECIHIKSSYRIRRYQRTAAGHPQAPRTGRVFATYLRKDTKSRAQKQASA